jgi:hypothetical protein
MPLITRGVQVMELPVKYNFLLPLLSLRGDKNFPQQLAVALKLLTVAITVLGNRKVMNLMFYAQFCCSTGLHLASIYL